MNDFYVLSYNSQSKLQKQFFGLEYSSWHVKLYSLNLLSKTASTSDSHQSNLGKLEDQNK